MTATIFPTAEATPPQRRIPNRRASHTLLLGALLSLVGAVLGWFAYTQAARGVEVVALARAVQFGATIATGDLREATLPTGSTLRTISWDDRQTVVGLVATTDLPADQLLSPDAVGQTHLPSAGEAVVGLPIIAGRLPASGLAPRDQVLVVRPATPEASVRATVLNVGSPDAAGHRTVDLLFPESAIDAVAAAAGDETTLLVLVAAR